MLINKTIDLELLTQTIKILNNNFDDNSPKSLQQLHQFHKYLRNQDLLDTNYLNNYQLLQDKDISIMTQEEVLTSLTFFIRGDRFCEGLLASALEDGTFLKLLIRLKQVNIS